MNTTMVILPEPDKATVLARLQRLRDWFARVSDVYSCYDHATRIRAFHDKRAIDVAIRAVKAMP